MSTSTNPSRRTQRRRVVLGASAIAIAAAVTFSATGAPAKEESPKYSPEFLESVSRYAEAHGLTGLSPASLRPVEATEASACHGLSPVSAVGCTADEIERATGQPE